MFDSFVPSRSMIEGTTSMSWTVHDCVGLFESKQLERFEVTRSVIDTRTGRLRGMCGD